MVNSFAGKATPCKEQEKVMFEMPSEMTNRLLLLDGVRSSARAMRDQARRAYDAGLPVEIAPLSYLTMATLLEVCIEVLDRHDLQPEVKREMAARAVATLAMTPEEARRT